MYLFVHIPRTGGSNFIKNCKKNNISKIKFLNHNNSVTCQKNTNIIFTFRNPLIHLISSLKNNKWDYRQKLYKKWLNKEDITKEDIKYTDHFHLETSNMYLEFKNCDDFIDKLLNKDKTAMKYYDLMVKHLNYYPYSRFFNSEHLKNSKEIYSIELENHNEQTEKIFYKLFKVNVKIEGVSETGNTYENYTEKYEKKFTELFPKEIELYNHFKNINTKQFL